MINQKVLEDVVDERIKQNEKWGTQDHDWGDWMLILGEEFGETCEEMLNNRFGRDKHGKMHRIKELREEAVQLVAVGVAIIEYVDRAYPNEF